MFFIQDWIQILLLENQVQKSQVRLNDFFLILDF